MPRLATLLLVTSLLIVPLSAAEQGRIITELPEVLPHRQRAETVNRLLLDRLDNLLPDLMRETGIDMWLVINREYNEDPVYLTLVPEPAFAARRLTMLVFHAPGPGQGLERLSVSRYAIEGFYKAAWDGGSDEEQWQRLAEIVRERNPKRIGIDTSGDWAFGDGLSAALRDRLVAALGRKLARRLVGAEELCIRWLETRTALEMEVYPRIVALARGVIAEAFSERVITPGVTTTTDVAWYIRQRYEDLGLPIWFMPYVNVQRHGLSHDTEALFMGESDVIIRRGDVLHTDVGITYLRLSTDTQEMGYVLRPGEEEVPPGLRRALETGNRWQDLVTGRFAAGRSGNEILAAAREAAEAEGIEAAVYSHPVGFYGHGPGPIIGMWDNQGPTPVHGDWKVFPSTVYAIEGNVKVRIPEWDDQWVQIKLEQTALFDGERVVYLAGRQTRWHLIR